MAVDLEPHTKTLDFFKGFCVGFVCVPQEIAALQEVVPVKALHKAGEGCIRIAGTLWEEKSVSAAKEIVNFADRLSLKENSFMKDEKIMNRIFEYSIL